MATSLGVKYRTPQTSRAHPAGPLPQTASISGLREPFLVSTRFVSEDPVDKRGDRTPAVIQDQQ